MAGKEIQVGRAYVELLLKDSQFVKKLKNSSKMLKSYGSNIAMIGAGITSLGASIVAPIIGAVKHFASFGDTLDKTSQRTGVAASSLAEFKFAAEQSGAGLETVEKGLFGLSRSFFDLSRGGKLAKDSFAEIGLTLDDLQGKAPEDQFQLVADGLAKIEDASKRGAVSSKDPRPSRPRIAPNAGEYARPPATSSRFKPRTFRGVGKKRGRSYRRNEYR